MCRLDAAETGAAASVEAAFLFLPSQMASWVITKEEPYRPATFFVVVDGAPDAGLVPVECGGGEGRKVQAQVKLAVYPFREM